MRDKNSGVLHSAQGRPHEGALVAPIQQMQLLDGLEPDDQTARLIVAQFEGRTRHR
jgi:hypothetical protein